MGLDPSEFDGWHVEYEEDGESPDPALGGGGVGDREFFTGAVIRFEPQYGGEGEIVGSEVRVVADGIASPADARLIAAAPDLRDALEAMVRVDGGAGAPEARAAADLAARALARLDPHPLDVDGGHYRPRRQREA